MSLMDSPAFHLSQSSFLRAADNLGRPRLATPIPPIRTTPKTLPCCTDRLNPPQPSLPKRTGLGKHLSVHRGTEGKALGPAAVPNVWRIALWLLRLEEPSAFGEGQIRCCSHTENRNGSPPEQSHLWGTENPCRA